MIRATAKALVRATYRFQRRVILRRGDLPFILNELGLFGIGVEVGVKLGTYSAYLLRHWNGRVLYSIDPYGQPPGEPFSPHIATEQEYLTAVKTLERFGGRSVLVREASPYAAEFFEDGALDFCYIDALHQYASVKQDVEAWYPKVKPGGILAGHDYLNGIYREVEYGVKQAVDEFCDAHSLRPVITREADTPSWVIFK